MGERASATREADKARSRVWLATLGLVLASSSLAHAQMGTTRATVSLTADRTELDVGEVVRLQARADVTGAEVDHFEEPDVRGFAVRSRQISRPLQFRFGFGNQQQVVQSSTVYSYLLQAETPGTYTIGPLEVRAGGRTFQSNEVVVTVRGAAGTSPEPTPTPATPAGPVVDGYTPDAEAFVRTTADVANPYVGQQVTISVFLYTRATIRGGLQLPRSPTTDGFWTVDLLDGGALDGDTQYVNGALYRVYRILHMAAFPLREGELTIGAPEVSFQAGSTFDLFQPPQEMRRTGVPVNVTVRPVPTPNAVVGRYTIESTVDRESVRTGDAVTLTATVRGDGNVRDVRLDLPNIDGLQVLQPRVDDEVQHPSDRVGGMRRFEWLVVPQRAGTFEIPPFTLVTFDPAAETTQTVQSGALRITAVGATITPDVPDAGPARAEPETTTPDPETPAPTFGPLRTESTLARATTPTSSTPLFWGLLLGLPLLGLVLLTARALRGRKPDAATEKRRETKRRLDDAERFAREGDARNFYSAIAVGLQGALEARLGEAVGALTHDELRKLLRRRGLDEDLVRRVIDELEVCDFARFSSAGGAPEEIRDCLERTRRALAELESASLAPTEAS
ncbi:MAG: protein BatD [Sandaracinus sp.]|nr:protein BatD [Sandaracinus sp.]